MPLKHSCLIRKSEAATFTSRIQDLHQQTSEKVSASPNVSRIPPPGHWFKLTSTCFARQDFAYVYNTVRNSGTCRETLLHMSHTDEKTETCTDDNDESCETDGNDEMCISSPEKDTSFVDVNAALAKLEETRAKKVNLHLIIGKPRGNNVMN